MSAWSRPRAAAGLWALALVLVAGATCFDGGATLGAACERDTDCGGAQSCDNGVCGLCGNGRVDPGELCFGPSRDYAVRGEIRGLFVVDLDGQFDRDVAVVTNDFCPMDENADPITFEPCFRTELLVSTRSREHLVIDLPPEMGDFGRVNAFEVADFDADGLLDAVMVFEESSLLFVVYGLGTNQTAPDPLAFVLPAPAVDVLVGDLDSDGALDLLAGTRLPVAPLLAFWGNGAGGFDPGEAIDAGDGARMSNVVDFDGDGRVEFAVANVLDTTVTVLRNVDGRTFDIASRIDLANRPWNVMAADLDGDDAPEIVASLPDDDRVAVVPNVSGTPVEAETTFLEAPSGPTDVLLADADADGDLDVFVARSGTDRVRVFVNRDGTFPDHSDLDVGPSPLFMVREDLDGDGADDMVVANGSSTISIVYPDF